MKRFLSLLTVFMLAFTLIVPASAAGNTLSGTWYINSIDGLYTDTGWYGTESVNFTSNGKSYVAFYGRNYTQLGYMYDFPNEYDFAYNGSWTSDEFRTVYFGSAPQTVGEGFYKWFTKNATQIETPFCDGTTCPATDLNFDDVCDDCGMPLAYNLRVTPNTYEVVVKHSDSLTLKYSYTETLAGTSFDAVYDDNRITVSFDNPVDHYQYKLNNGEWELNASYPNTSGSHAISLSGNASILASDMDIYDSNGDLFFQNPLWMTVEKVTQGEMGTLTSETAGTMKTLVVCGVGLMACLMALSLFGKRWLLFLR